MAQPAFFAFIFAIALSIFTPNESWAATKCVNNGNSDQCLICACYFEAGSKTEPFEGKVAVVQTILTRVSRPDFPNTACGVVYQRYNGRAQFNWVDDSKSNTMSNASQVADCTRAVAEGKKRGANGFVAFQSSGEKWTWVKYCETIGNHKFYAKTKAQCPSSRATASASASAKEKKPYVRTKPMPRKPNLNRAQPKSSSSK